MNEVQTSVNSSCCHLTLQGTNIEIDKVGPKKKTQMWKIKEEQGYGQGVTSSSFYVNITLQTLTEQTDPYPEPRWMQTWVYAHTRSRLRKYAHTGLSRVTFVLQTGLHTPGCSHRSEITIILLVRRLR